MVATGSNILFGRSRIDHRPFVLLSLAVGLFATTFAGYALGVFYVSGGVVFIPYYAAVVGMIAAGAVGYSQNGVVFAWIVAYTSLLGYHADHAFLGLSGRPFSHQFAYFVHLEGLVVFAVEGVVLGTLAFSFGYLVRGGTEYIRR